MKRLISTPLSLRQLRCLDFYKACRRAMLTESCPSVSRLVEKVAAESAPSYYVEYTTARRTLTRVRKKQIMPYGGRGFGAIYAELFRRCMAEKVRYGVSDSQALGRVLCEGNASCWFMSGQSARSSYYAGRSLYRRLAVNEAA